MKTVEELLRDRYKVIGPYPFSPYNIGDIITVEPDRKYFIASETCRNAYSLPNTKLKDMPNIFQPLPWWSDRKVEDMPAFVKGGGYYYKHEYCITDGKLMFNQYCNGHPIGWLPVNKEFDFYTPVSDEEYELFKHPHL